MAAVKFRGLDARTGMARWGLAAVAIGIVVGVTAPAAANGLAMVMEANPQSLVSSQAAVRLARLPRRRRLGGLRAAALDEAPGRDRAQADHLLPPQGPRRDRPGPGRQSTGSCWAWTHSVPFTFAQILVPGLAPHAPVAVAFGQVALYLTAIVTASFYVRRRIGQRTWRTFHYPTFLVFVGVTVHGIAAGSDSARRGPRRSTSARRPS